MKKIVLKIEGMHCASCSLNIDFALEDLGVKSVKTSYAKTQTEVEYDPEKISQQKIIEAIKKLGYNVTISL